MLPIITLFKVDIISIETTKPDTPDFLIYYEKYGRGLFPLFNPLIGLNLTPLAHKGRWL